MGIKIKNNNFIKSDFPRWKGMKYKFQIYDFYLPVFVQIL